MVSRRAYLPLCAGQGRSANIVVSAPTAIVEAQNKAKAYDLAVAEVEAVKRELSALSSAPASA